VKNKGRGNKKLKHKKGEKWQIKRERETNRKGQ
jgi:hypothetical protein